MKGILGIMILCFCIFNPQTGNGQIFSTPGLNGLSASPGSYPGSPETNQASGYENTVDNFTGSKTINLPLFNFESRNFTLPISLNYRTNGVKIADIATWVGLKWNLNAGGMITRTVRDIPDETTNGRLKLKHSYNIDLDTKISNVTSNNDATNAGYLSDLGLNLSSSEHFDKEPDIFTYNINGRTGQFTLDQDANVKLIPYCGLKIITDYQLSAFEITDENGVTYYFSDIEQTQIDSYGWAASTRVEPYSDYSTSSTTYTTGWYLNSIALPILEKSGDDIIQESINFSYTDETYEITEPQDIWSRSCVSSNCVTLGLYATGSPNAVVNSTTTIHARRLTSIWDSNTVVDFVAETSREDISTSKRLDFIKISSKIPELKEYKRYYFQYHYYEGTADNNYLSNHVSSGTPKRLMLHGVSESTDPEPPVGPRLSIPLYHFDYDESATIPSRFSMEQDFWGYYNGSGANTIFPQLYFYPDETGYDRYSIYPKAGYVGTEIILQGADRTPNASAMVLGSLNKITYRGGGYTTYEYEPNDFYYDGSNRYGSGLRIKKTIVHDGIDHSRDIVKEFLYKRSSDALKSSGLMIDMPVFGSWENTHCYSMSACSTLNFTDPSQTWYYEDFFVRRTQPIFNSGITDGITQGYTEIVEKSADNSRIYRKFSLPGYYKQDLDDQVGVNCFLNADGYCDGLFKRYYSHYCAVNGNFGISPDLSGYDFTSNSIFPFAPSTNYDWNRGLLLETKYYDSDDFLLKENTFSYKLFYPEAKTSPDYVPGIKLQVTDNWKLDPSNNWTTNLQGFYYAGLAFFSKYELVTEVAKVPATETEKSYDKAHPGEYNQVITTYEYNGYFHNNPSKVITTDSKGVQKITEHTYAFDLKNPPEHIAYFPATYPQRGYKALVTRHMNPVIKKLQTIIYPGSADELVIGGFINYYDANFITDLLKYSTVLPKEQKILNLNVPILKSSLTDNISNSGVFVDSRYKTENTVNAHDLLGNPLEYANKTEKQATIWGYNHAYPVAQVKNASYSDVAYTSFESPDSKGGWDYTGDATADITSPTGKNCINVADVYIQKSGLDISKTYIVSYWAKSSLLVSIGVPGTVKQGLTINGWTYFEHTVTGTDYFIIAAPASCYIDELRLYTKNALMVTSTYDPLIGVTSRCDINNNITYYEYDVLGRPSVIRDQYRNIIKTFEFGFGEEF